jgi:hypothetical protein
MTRIRLVPILASLALFAACDKSGGGGSAGDSLYAQSDSPDNLKGLLQAVVAANAAGDVKKAAALTRGLIPDKAALGKALKDDAPAQVADGVLTMGSSLPADDAKVAGLIHPSSAAQTEVQVHGATTEEIAEYKNGSVAFAEFPGGARRLAEQALRPGTKFYEVEFLEPGKQDGMKFHMFFFDGAKWRMLGPAWRGLK